MKTIGLVGGIASGKSWIAARLAEWGAVVVDADRLGHEALAESGVQAALRERFGEEIFDSAGGVDRKMIASRVFGPSPEHAQALRDLEAVVHPRITAKMKETLAAAEAAGRPAAVLDAPLLLEAGWDRLCDAVWFVDAPAADRASRAVARGWTPEQFSSREAAQSGLDLKRARADCIIPNVGSAESVSTRLARCWQSLLHGTTSLPSPGDRSS